ncbi:MAG: hypothetical protein U0528_10885 [Anaerolineae bacterium]|nr:hypothetical protein [Anaerolineae bacterium]
MAHVQVTVPAVALDLGSGVGSGSLALALGLHNVIEAAISNDGETLVAVEGASDLAGELVLRGVEAVMHALKREMPPLTVLCNASIPSRCGLGDEETWLIGGLMAINNLIGAPLKRTQIADIALRLTSTPSAAVTSLIGGLAVVSSSGNDLIYRRLDVTAGKVVLALPEVADYRVKASRVISQRASDPAMQELWRQSGARAVLFVEALRRGDYGLLAQVTSNPPLDAERLALLPGSDAAISAAKQAGASAVLISGDGPALVCFAEKDHQQIAAVLRTSFANAGIKCRTWIVNIDTQGVTLTVRG